MPKGMNYTYTNCSVELNPQLSNEHLSAGLSVDVKTPGSVSCDVYSFGQVDQFGAMALIYLKNPITVTYVENHYGSDGLVFEQVLKTETLSGWHTTMNKNLVP